MQFTVYGISGEARAVIEAPSAGDAERAARVLGLGVIAKVSPVSARSLAQAFEGLGLSHEAARAAAAGPTTQRRLPHYNAIDVLLGGRGKAARFKEQAARESQLAVETRLTEGFKRLGLSDSAAATAVEGRR